MDILPCASRWGDAAGHEKLWEQVTVPQGPLKSSLKGNYGLDLGPRIPLPMAHEETEPHILQAEVFWPVCQWP